MVFTPLIPKMREKQSNNYRYKISQNHIKGSRPRIKRTGFARSFFRREYDIRRLLANCLHRDLYKEAQKLRFRLEIHLIAIGICIKRLVKSSSYCRLLKNVFPLLAFAQTIKVLFKVFWSLATLAKVSGSTTRS